MQIFTFSHSQSTGPRKKKKERGQSKMCSVLKNTVPKTEKSSIFLSYSAWLETALDSSEVLLSEEVLLETEEVSSASEETLLSEEAVEVP